MNISTTIDDDLIGVLWGSYLKKNRDQLSISIVAILVVRTCRLHCSKSMILALGEKFSNII